MSDVVRLYNLNSTSKELMKGGNKTMNLKWGGGGVITRILDLRLMDIISIICIYLSSFHLINNPWMEEVFACMCKYYLLV